MGKCIGNGHARHRFPDISSDTLASIVGSDMAFGKRLECTLVSYEIAASKIGYRLEGAPQLCSVALTIVLLSAQWID
jgi:hypothetical protein